MNTRLTKQSMLVASQDQVSADVSSNQSGDVVVLHLKKGVYYTLNATGARIWELIQQPCSFESVLNTILDDYDVDAEQCEADLRNLMEEMVGRGLIDVTHESGS